MATPTPTPTRALFTPIYSEEEKVIMLEEYKHFIETNGLENSNKWIWFHQTCSLKEKYRSKQLCKKITELRTKFQKQKKNSDLFPSDPHKLRLFQLSKSVWGDHDQDQQDQPHPNTRFLTVTPNDHQPSEKKYSDSDVEELQLYHNSLIIYLKQYGMVLQQYSSKELNTPSSSLVEKIQTKKRKQTKGKENLTVEDPIFFETEPDELEYAKELSLQILDAAIKVDKNISQDAQEPKAMDISIDCDCVEEKTKYQLLNSLKSGDMEDVLQLQVPTGDKVEEDDTEKTSSILPQVKTQPFGLVTQVLEEGDPNKKTVCKGAKVKVHVTARVKDSDGLPFESRVCRLKLGDERLIEGLRIGIIGMRVGDKRRFTIPPYLGYGKEGCKGVVPPNSWIVYEIKLLAHGRVK